jgi:hypothetical protein
MTQTPGTPKPATDQNSPESVYRALVRLLESQTALYGQLDALSERQRAVIEDDDADRLLSILGERQTIVDRIAMTNRDLEPVRVAWERLLERVRPECRSDVARRLEGLSVLAGRIAQRDDEDRRKLESRRNAIAGELASMNTSRRAVSAYGRPAAPPASPRFQDRQA